MKIRIECNLDNAAFEDNQLELSEIIARQIPHNPPPGTFTGYLRDSNGNTVGSWKIED